MKKILRGLVLMMTLGLSGCTGLEMLLVGGSMGGLGASYLKPWMDKYLTPAPVPVPDDLPIVIK